jgi:signal peptidase I
MKRTIIITLIIVSCLFIAWYVAGITHMFEVVAISATSSQPTYKPGDKVFASKFKKPDNNLTILFKGPDKATWLFRCIGKEGDVIEMKHETVYLNGKILNEPYAWNEYCIRKDQLNLIIGYIEQNKNTVNAINDSLFFIALTSKEIKEYNLDLKPYAAPKDSINPGIYPDFKRMGYNEDNFGPLKIPKDCYFVLGDNRHDAFDSRYFGFVKKEDVISTVLN